MCGCEKIRNTDGYVIAWRCWIEVDKKIEEFNSLDDKWCEIPEDGFQAMRLWYNDGSSRYISGNDWYFIQEHPAGLVFGQSNDNDAKERYPGAIFKRGRHIPDILMKYVNELMTKAIIPSNGDN